MSKELNPPQASLHDRIIHYIPLVSSLVSLLNRNYPILANHLIWIELSFAARRLESSGGRSLHNERASSKLPDAVNWTIYNGQVKYLTS